MEEKCGGSVISNNVIQVDCLLFKDTKLTTAERSIRSFLLGLVIRNGGGGGGKGTIMIKK